MLDSSAITVGKDGSLSSRRAWIEIPVESVKEIMSPRSLSSRRAWIEIDSKYRFVTLDYVALLTESVD